MGTIKIQNNCGQINTVSIVNEKTGEEKVLQKLPVSKQLDSRSYEKGHFISEISVPSEWEDSGKYIKIQVKKEDVR